MFTNLPYLAVVIIIMIGLYAVVFKKNILKVIIGITIIESGVNLFLVTTGYRNNSVAPIYTNVLQESMVLPTPQALTLTSIVIGLAVLALMLSIVVMIYKSYGTLDVRKINQLKK